MSDKKLTYQCPVCGKEYKKDEINNGIIPLHIFNKEQCQGTAKQAIVRRK